MKAALQKYQALQPNYQLHATSFVIASPLARAQIQEKEMLGYPWMSDRWWNPAIESGLFHIASHSYDHLSPSAEPVRHSLGVRGDFTAVQTHADADSQIRKARELIEFIAPNPAVAKGQALFAYPFGHTNDFLKREYFPNFFDEHGTVAACTTEAELTHAHSDLFALPRFVFGTDWKEISDLPWL